LVAKLAESVVVSMPLAASALVRNEAILIADTCLRWGGVWASASGTGNES